MMAPDYLINAQIRAATTRVSKMLEPVLFLDTFNSQLNMGFISRPNYLVF